jgi:hypothetical protein
MGFLGPWGAQFHESRKANKEQGRLRAVGLVVLPLFPFGMLNEPSGKCCGLDAMSAFITSVVASFLVAKP